MKKEDLIKLKDKLSKLSEQESKLRDLYLRRLAIGEIQGPLTGYASIDEPWFKRYGEDAILDDIPKNISVYDYMKSKNIDNPNRIAINYYDNLLTYSDLFDEVEKYARKFYELGVREGDIVSICMPSTPETVIAFYALNSLGAVCDMIDPRSNPGQLEYYLRENKSKMLILCSSYHKKLSPSLNVDTLEKVIVAPITQRAPLFFKLIVDLKSKVDNIGVEENSKVISWKEFEKIKGIEAPHVINSDDIAIIIHSSGTTKLPKGIILTNSNVNAIAFQYKKTSLRLEPGAKFLSVIPAFASFGVVASINLPLTLSMENILIPLVSPKNFIKNMKKYDINFTLTVPANFKFLSKQKKFKKLTNLYGPGCGGYSLNSVEEKEINDFLEENGAPVPMLMGWGLTEGASTVTLEVPECSKLLSSGVPLCKNKVAIFKPGTDEELQYYKEGEICVNGPSVMKGYLNNPEKTAETIFKHSDGSYWLHTGDIGYMDSDGRLFPIDRMERMIVKGVDGFKIYPQKLEEVIATSKYVNTCCVVGYNDLEKGVIPKAYIVLKDEYLGMKDEALFDIKTKCNFGLSVRAIPDEFEFIDALPYTDMGKVNFKLLEKGLSKKEVKVKKRKFLDFIKFKK